jgi:N6-L-threonylcarbamoyladenine synthase
VAGHIPLILGFDTSAAACRVALMRGETVLAQHCEAMVKGQAESLLPLCENMLRAVGVSIKDLDAIGVGTGPGHFTGIRIAVSAARGLALGLGVPAIGVSAFDALQDGANGPCACAVDARHSEVYLQIYNDEKTAGPPVLLPAAELPPFDGPLIGHGGIAPAHPTAVAICRVAQARMGKAGTRPAPLYLRPADAAPARDAPPTILT